MKKQLSIFIITLIVSPYCSAQRYNFKKIEDSIAVILDQYHMAGLAVAIIQENQTIYSKGFGYRDYEKKQPVTSTTIFGIGSITKSFTAAILGILEGKEKVALTDSPTTYIPELKFANPIMTNTIEIRHLLSHSTGIPSLSTESSCVLFQSQRKEDLIQRLAHLPPISTVNDQFIYNNYMYTIAGIISERITNKPWNENIKELIFKSLEMNQSYIGVEKAKASNNFSLGYSVRQNAPYPVLPERIPTRAPAGDIYSNINDMSNWVKLWLNEGIRDATQIVPLPYIEQAIRPQQIISGTPRSRNSRLPKFSNYGYGWFNSEYRGYYKVEHSGGISGYSANIAFYPTENIGIVILTNQSTSNACYKLTDIISDELFSMDSSDANYSIQYGTVREINSSPSEIVFNSEQPPTHTINDFLGKYTHPGFGTIHITMNNGLLFAEFPFTKYRLEHREGNVFIENFTVEVPQVVGLFMEFNFINNTKGEITGLTLNLDETPIEFIKL